MKKLLKWGLIVLAALIALLVLASVLLYMFMPLDAIKDFAAAKLSETMKREVKIKGVSFNLFSGIKLTGITISNRKGFDDRPFISADSIELKYAFWPLLRGQVIIPEIALIKPQILIEKSRKGDMNFSDMLSAGKSAPAPSPSKEQKSLPIDLIINTFAIKRGQILYIDYLAGSESGLQDINVRISGITLALLKPIDIKASANGNYQNKDIPISIAGKLGIDLEKNIIDLPHFAVSVAGETLHIKATSTKGKIIKASLSSDKLRLDPFLAIFASAPPKEKKAKPVKGALTASLKSMAQALPADLVLDSDLDLKNVSLADLKLDTLKVDLGLAKRVASVNIKEVLAYDGKLAIKGMINLPLLSYNFGKLELKGFNSAPFLNSLIGSFFPDLLDMKNKVEGKLDLRGWVKGSGVEMPEAFDNLRASATVVLTDGRIKKIKALESIGEKYGVNLLKNDMIVRGLRGDMSLANKVLAVEKLSVQDTDLQVSFVGGLDFNKMEYVKGNRLTLTFSPAVVKDLPREFSVFKDERGFASVDVELVGKLAKPFPNLRLERPLETAVGKLKVKVEAKKVEIETKAKEAAEEAKEKLKEEAKQKVKEILKF